MRDRLRGSDWPHQSSETVFKGAHFWVVSTTWSEWSLAGPNTAAEANRATGGALVRLALDGVGGDATGTLMDVVGWEAKIVCYAFPTREPITFNPFGMLAKRASIHPFFMHYPDNLPKIPEKIRSAAALVANRQLRLPIAAVYPVGHFEKALHHALEGGKILLDFTGES